MNDCTTGTPFIERNIFLCQTVHDFFTAIWYALCNFGISPFCKLSGALFHAPQVNMVSSDVFICTTLAGALVSNDLYVLQLKQTGFCSRSSFDETQENGMRPGISWPSNFSVFQVAFYSQHILEGAIVQVVRYNFLFIPYQCLILQAPLWFDRSYQNKKEASYKPNRHSCLFFVVLLDRQQSLWSKLESWAKTEK